MQQLKLDLKYVKELHRPDFHGLVFEKVNLVGEILHVDGGRYEVYQECEIVDVPYGAGGLLRGERCRGNDFRGLLLQRIGNDPDVRMRHVRIDVFKILYPGLQIWLGGHHAAHLEPLQALKNRRHCAVRHLEGLDDPGCRSVWEEVIFHRVLHHHVILRDCTDDAVFPVGLIDELHGLLPSDGYRVNGPGEEDSVPQCQNRQGVRQRCRFHLSRHFPGCNRYDAHFRSCGCKNIAVEIFHHSLDYNEYI